MKILMNTFLRKIRDYSGLQIFWFEWYCTYFKKEKYFFTDGRYILQAKKEIEEDFQIIDLSDEDFFLFLKKQLVIKSY